MPIRRAHPAEGALQALLDGELAPLARLRLRLHLRHCPPCRLRLAAARERGTAIRALLRQVAPSVDAEDAWARLVVRSGGRTARRARLRGIPPTLAAALAVLGLLGAWTLHPALRPAARTAAGPVDADELFALVRTAQAHPTDQAVRDHCCGDHDGGDRADDGLLTLSRPGERVAIVVVYEDVDGSGTFTPGDIVRYVSNTPQ